MTDELYRLYFGELNPCEQKPTPGPADEALLQQYDALKNALPESFRDAFEAFVNAQSAQHARDEADAFVSGMRLGARLYAELTDGK